MKRGAASCEDKSSARLLVAASRPRPRHSRICNLIVPSEQPFRPSDKPIVNAFNHRSQCHRLSVQQPCALWRRLCEASSLAHLLFKQRCFNDAPSAQPPSNEATIPRPASFKWENCKAQHSALSPSEESAKTTQPSAQDCFVCLQKSLYPLLQKSRSLKLTTIP